MRYLFSVLTLTAILLPTISQAQFYKVYGYETLEQGEIEGVLWNSYIPKSDGAISYFGKPASRKGLWGHSLELEYGLTDQLTLAARADFMDPKGGSFKYIQARAILLHYRFGEPGEYFFNPAVLLEYSIPRSSYSPTEELELRLILEREFGESITLRLNPIFKMATSGPESEEGAEFEYAAGIYYSQSHIIQPGLEIYGEIGELSRPEPFEQQGFALFPSLNLHLGNFHWNLGVGFGITDESDDITVKSILSYGF